MTFMTGISALLAVLTFALYLEHRADARRTHCRCCGTALRTPGGHSVSLIGRGYCRQCVARTMADAS